MKTQDSKLQTRRSKAHRNLAADLAEYDFDPYGWVLYAFPWGEGELAGVGGPVTWQREQLEAIGAKLRGGPAASRSAEIMVAVPPPRRFLPFLLPLILPFLLPLLVAILQGQIPF